MTTELLNNINFKLLLKQHGDYGRAKAAWDKICSLGRFGDVPASYEGGLDLQGLRRMYDERTQGQAQALTLNPGYALGRGGDLDHANTLAPEAPDDLHDRIKQIEDIAMGDKP